MVWQCRSANPNTGEDMEGSRAGCEGISMPRRPDGVPAVREDVVRPRP
jgi:hypothetical protein